MQKTNMADHHPRAAAILRRALPSGAELEPVPEKSEVAVFRILLENLPSITIIFGTDTRTVESGEEGDQPIPLMILQTRTRKERERLRRQGENFIDLAGAVRLRAPGLYIDRDDLRPASRPAGRVSRVDPYADRASRVVRTLLTSPTSRRWSNQELADAAGVDDSTASRVTGELRRRELVRDQSPGQGRKSQLWVPDPPNLLEDWVRSYRWLDNRQLRVAAPIGSPRAFVARMPELLPDDSWALTLHSGASLLAPHATFDLVHVYLSDEASPRAVAMEQGWEISSSGRLCLLEPHYRESIWFDRHTVEGVPVVNPVQLVLDLWHYPVRGREQARHLVDTLLEPIWTSSDASR